MWMLSCLTNEALSFYLGKAALTRDFYLSLARSPDHSDLQRMLYICLQIQGSFSRENVFYHLTSLDNLPSIHTILHISALYTECISSLSKRITPSSPPAAVFLFKLRMSSWYVSLPGRSACGSIVLGDSSPHMGCTDHWPLGVPRGWKWEASTNLRICVLDAVYNVCTFFTPLVIKPKWKQPWTESKSEFLLT